MTVSNHIDGLRSRLCRHCGARNLALRASVAVILAGSFNLSLASTEDPDSIAHQNLDEIVIEAQRKSASALDSEGTLHFSTEAISTRARVLGEPDILNTVRQSAGVKQVSDYGAGMTVNGYQFSQTAITLDGAPVLFPYRFGGLFSTFNTPHFSEATFTTTGHDIAFGSRLGGSVDVHGHKRHPGRLTGSVNIGLLGSAATLRIPVSGKFSVAMSARVSYLNLFYRPWLKIDGGQLLYDFQDYNVSALWTPGSSDVVSVQLMHSSDCLKLDDPHYGTDTSMKWHNSLASVSWNHTGRIETETSLFYSLFSNKMLIGLSNMDFKVPSSLGDLGIRTSLTPAVLKQSRVSPRFGASIDYFTNHPQTTAMSIASGPKRRSPEASATMTSARLWEAADCRLGSGLTLTPGLSVTCYHHSGGYTTVYPDGRLTLTSESIAGTFRLQAGTYSQYLHQTGFSDIGIASDFWFGAEKDCPVQRALTFSLSWQRPVLDDRFTLHAEVSYSMLKNQAEYDGMIYDIIDDCYDFMDHILVTQGHNWNVNLEIRKDFGDITGSLFYSYSGTSRHLPSEPEKTWRSTVDQGNAAGISADWKISSHWLVNASFRYADGRVFTPARSLYIVAGTLMTEYGERNSARFPSYQRLDLSATYSCRSGRGGRLRHYVNISLLNAYGHKNVEMQYYKVDPETLSVYLRRNYSMFRFLPSLSYTLEF